MQPFTRQLQQLNYNNGNGDVFYVVRAEQLSRRQMGNPFELLVESPPVKRRLRGWYEMAASQGVICQLSAEI
jgi:hypothetical protein